MRRNSIDCTLNPYHRILGPAAAFVIASSACQTDTARLPAVVVRDSAGIEVVENRTPAWAADDIWTVAPHPEIVIGGNDASASPGDSTHLVWSVTDVAPLSDGRLAVLSSREKRVFLFEPSGEFVRSIGREGRGPGEFGYPEHLQILPGDTLVVWDYMFGPVTYFNPAGEVLRSWRVDVGAVLAEVRKPNQMSPERVHLPMADGSYIVQVGLVPGSSIPPQGVPDRLPVEFVRIDSAYAAYSLGRWEEQEFLYSRGVYPLLPFPLGVQLAAGDSPLVVYISSSDRYEVQQFTGTGALVRIIRRTAEPIPITATDVEEWRDRVSPSVAWDWDAWDRIVADLPPRSFRPPVVGLLVDSQGYLWVKDRADPGNSVWSVFDPAGRWQGTLEVPLERLEWVGPELILGVNRDPATGLEAVEGYRLSR